MKTLVVFSALAAVAIAAPALLDEIPEESKTTITSFPEISKRERKSPHEELSAGSNPTQEAPVNLPSTSQITEFGVTGRSFGVKKPIIIKKKQGYHVYRSSDEEPVESRESCGQQVKVKLCDVKSADMRSSAIEDVNHMTEEDMKHSIKLAKEAVENFQRDLKTIEHTSDPKGTAWKHGHSKSDAELHKDIEVAREALEHIHKNFRNVESMKLPGPSLRDVDTVHNTQSTTVNTEEQRLSQWKEAVKAIHKNVEIARNIEDSFRTGSVETEPLFTKDMTEHNDNDHHKKADQMMRITENMETKNENKLDCKEKHMHVKSSEPETTNTELVEDMASSASTMSVTKMKDLSNDHRARHSSEVANVHIESDKLLDTTQKAKNVDMDSFSIDKPSLKESLSSDSMKVLENAKERNTKPGNMDKHLEITGSKDSIFDSSATKMKSTEPQNMFTDQQRETMTMTDNLQSQTSLVHDEHLKNLESKNDEHSKLKLAENFENINDAKVKGDKTEDKNLQTDQTKNIDATMFTKSAEPVPIQMQRELNHHNKLHENMGHSSEEKSDAHTEDLKHQAVHLVAPVSNTEQMLTHQHIQMHPEMRTANELKHMHQHQFVDPSQTRWADDNLKNFNFQSESMKSADGIHSPTNSHAEKMLIPSHHLHHGLSNHHISTHHGQPLSRVPDDLMLQGKSADRDVQAYYMSMRDGSSLKPENHRFRWKPMHESLRNAYGPPGAPISINSGGGGGGSGVDGSSGSGGSTAVGIFPNANTGPCGIPILLSCNPSLVTGSLAKPRPSSYSAPSYRMEDDFNFHTKRDVKNTQESLLKSLNRSPANANLKTSTVLVAKQ